MKQTPEERALTRAREYYALPGVEDIPDERLEKTFAYQSFLANELIRDFAEELGKEAVRIWRKVKERLGYKEAKP